MFLFGFWGIYLDIFLLIDLGYHCDCIISVSSYWRLKKVFSKTSFSYMTVACFYMEIAVGKLLVTTFCRL